MTSEISFTISMSNQGMVSCCRNNNATSRSLVVNSSMLRLYNKTGPWKMLGIDFWKIKNTVLRHKIVMNTLMSKKIVAIFQPTYILLNINAWLYNNIFAANSPPTAQLTIRHHASSHYLDRWWRSWLTHTCAHGINVLTMGKKGSTWQSNGAVYSTRLHILFICHPRTATKMITELFIIFQILFIDFIDCDLKTFRYSLHMNLTISIPYKTHLLNTHPISRQLLPLSFLQICHLQERQG